MIKGDWLEIKSKNKNLINILNTSTKIKKLGFNYYSFFIKET